SLVHASRGSGGGGGDERAGRDNEAPGLVAVFGQAGVDRLAQAVAPIGIEVRQRVGERDRERDAVLPPRVLVRVREGEVEGLDLDLGEPGLVEQRLDPSGWREGEHPRLAGLGRRRAQQALQLLGGDRGPHVALGGVPCGERDAAAGAKDPPGPRHPARSRGTRARRSASRRRPEPVEVFHDGKASGPLGESTRADSPEEPLVSNAVSDVTWTPAGEYSDIRYETSGDGIAKITIDRP